MMGQGRMTQFLTVAVILFGGSVLIAYLAGWLSPRWCEVLSAVPCWVVAGWYSGAALWGQGTTLHRWGWILLTVGWFLIGLAFAFRPGLGRIVALSSAMPCLLGGFGTVLLANWYAPIERGGGSS